MFWIFKHKKYFSGISINLTAEGDLIKGEGIVRFYKFDVVFLSCFIKFVIEIENFESR